MSPGQTQDQASVGFILSQRFLFSKLNFDDARMKDSSLSYLLPTVNLSALILSLALIRKHECNVGTLKIEIECIVVK
jgi:hypothetical protein